MKLTSTLLLLFPLSVFSRLTTMKDSATATNNNKAALDLSNGRVVYFEDSMEDHPEGHHGLVIKEIYQNDNQDLLDMSENEEQETSEDETQRALGHYGGHYGHNYNHHKKHYKPYYHHKKHYKPYYYYH